MNRCLALACALLLTSLAFSTACWAQSADLATRVVSYNDLDLSTPAGTASLWRRVDRALNYVCADPSGPSPAITINLDCKAEARSHVKPQIALAIAAQNAGKPFAGTRVSIRVARPQPQGPSNR